MEDSSQGGIRAYKFPFCIRGGVSLKFLLIQKEYNLRNTGSIPLHPSSLSLSQLLYNLMSQELFGKISKHRNNKQEEYRKSNRKRKKWKGISGISCTLSYFPTANIDNIREGQDMLSPPLFQNYSTLRRNPRTVYLIATETAPYVRIIEARHSFYFFLSFLSLVYNAQI